MTRIFHMQQFRRSRKRKASTLLALAAGAVVVTAGLAFAAEGNGSGGNGELFIGLSLVSAEPPCAEATRFAYQGTIPGGFFQATSGATVATYNGTVTFQWAKGNSETFEGPEGTFGDSCENPAGTGWPGSAQVAGTNDAGSSVLCQYTNATYSRSNFEDIMFTGDDGLCSITEAMSEGGDIVSNSLTDTTHTSTLGACDMMILPTHCDTTGDAYTATDG